MISILQKKDSHLLLCALYLFFLLPVCAQDVIPYAVPAQPWEEGLGNHRAVIDVKAPADAVKIDFLWRRHDRDPGSRRLMIIDASTGEAVKNIYRVQLTQERCALIFGPAKQKSRYYFYYLPYTPETKQYSPGPYLLPEDKPASSWVQKHKLSGTDKQFSDVTNATVSAIEARSDFHSFYPMEVCATAREQQNFITQHDSPLLVFPEDRAYPIRMRDVLPLKWTQAAKRGSFHGTAQKNEYYVFQLGIFAPRQQLSDIKLQYSDLKDNKGNSIPSAALTCFNTSGVNTKGVPFVKKVDIEKGAIQPLWIGVDIPATIIAGTYTGTVTVTTANLISTTLKVALTVGDSMLADRGDGETWRHSRLRWLNSTLGIDDEPTLRYKPLEIAGNLINATGKRVQLNGDGLPAVINPVDGNILASPIRFTVEINNRKVIFTSSLLEFTQKNKGVAKWKSTVNNDSLTILYEGEMDFDGRMNYQCRVTANTTMHIQDIRLEIPMKKAYATYMMGMGRMGGYTPANHLSRWSRTEDSFWIGETMGGIQCELRGGDYNGPLLNLYKPDPPASWFNGVNGGFRIDSDDTTVTASAYSGARQVVKGQTTTFSFSLLITPVKQPDLKSQFTDRYVHDPHPSAAAVSSGGNVMNVHHANKYNPYINYPFIAQKELRSLVDQWHQQHWKVKIYYTVRELSNHLTEIWALRSLGDEVLADGDGGGYQWLQEHLINHYTPQWYTHLGNGEVDAAILNGSESRWYNYYIEGLNWLMKNMDIDGLYLDDVSFDHNILQRMRKVMEKTKPGCLIDLHSNTAFSLGSANQNLEMFPYIDRTWFGEGFNFDLMPADFWLTEVSGIPFGMSNDQLLHMSVNNRRGMSFGMTQRGFTPMWTFWDAFGISDSKMIGYWDKGAPVKTSNKNVYVTTYVKKDKVLVALGSWVDAPVMVQLQIDWKALGLDAAHAKITAPEITGYQQLKSYNITDPIPVDAKGDYLLIITP